MHASGESPQEIAPAYRLAPEDIQAALLYAAELAKERVVPLRAIEHESNKGRSR